MILDGERIKSLLAGASREVVLCAPFIKVGALRVLMSVIDADIRLSVYTRWRADEVAAGVSDLEVFDLLKGRENAELRLLDELHAKLFVADDRCLAGSANITGAALGWSQYPNVELVLSADRAEPHVQQLLSRLERAELATFHTKSVVEAQAKKIEWPQLPASADIGEDVVSEMSSPWLPQCAAPDKLFRVYKDPETDAVVAGTREDALSDLNALLPLKGLSEAEFNEYVVQVLMQLPAVKEIFERVPSRVNDTQGADFIREIKPGMSASLNHKQWAIFRDWVRVFFADKYEVAPESYVVRLKPTNR